MQAVEAYQSAVKSDPEHHAAALALAKLHLDSGEEEAGRAVCAGLLAAQPDNVPAQLLMVQLMSMQVCHSCLCCCHDRVCVAGGLGGGGYQLLVSPISNLCCWLLIESSRRLSASVKLHQAVR